MVFDQLMGKIRRRFQSGCVVVLVEGVSGSVLGQMILELVETSSCYFFASSWFRD